MKAKLLVGALVAGFVSLGTVIGASAEPAQSEVTGVVTESQVAVAAATVTVTCNGNTETDTTDAMGSYLVSFLVAQCPFGSTVKVVAQKAGKSGVASGTMHGITTKLNLAIVNVSIPEFGTIGMLLAAGAGVGTMAYMRRRQQMQQDPQA